MNLVIIDCQNDFVHGALAAVNGEETVDAIVDFLKDHDDLKVFYSLDFHPTDHCSFKDQGGLWPAHCVADTDGAKVHEKFSQTKYPADINRSYYKGRDKDREEYSAFDAENDLGHLLRDDLEGPIYLAGIASEYCVRETALDFKKAGREVIVLKDLLGYIDQKDHEKNLQDLLDQGIQVQ
ncbi:hypothetical protein HMPREF1633_13580 [Tissierellia bacterium S5-A11]|nr:hypothetical protein HMPREF1633_13580 [Tissierellia bacterium S5-A11]